MKLTQAETSRHDEDYDPNNSYHREQTFPRSGRRHSGRADRVS
jgi:hypothetical protein